ncbi:hypothetical protein OB2597_10259 [Pseudooceanicola batsensis HTCC2597]|uniref:Uncharacterized protein n=1 Tax=Pseudooceanicola batsensis (strain ATCC BAA-863 / DSM 15984 / KCTC 12145 / HTCC2597) TaxID=252305 RepID=A3TVH4_PSEBH|nr:DUF6732 family protein [Pseudooceanicola batsensis]EAQ04520.1 hypothetical protein OB2597_10259 [Pseudooceanicola batsensis HTCC2597]
MRVSLAILLTAVAGPAAGHVGHLGEVAGHGHWLGAAALGAAIAIGLWQGLRGKSSDEGDEAEAEDEARDEEPQEA